MPWEGWKVMEMLNCSPRHGLTSAEYRGMITSLLLLVTLFLIQARMPFGLLGHLGTLLARVQLSINQHPQVCFFHSLPVTLPQNGSAIHLVCPSES